METKIISIDISPEALNSVHTENAGVMWEHNATSLVFNIDKKYIDNYKYYLEYRSILGTKIRTDYLELDTENNTVTYNIPVAMSSLRGVECWFNIVMIDEDGNTVQVIKPHRFCLQFDPSPDTDNSLAKVNDFSVNALLEAIRLGTFKGDKGETGDKGEKGDVGDKGETGEVSLEYANRNFADAVKKTTNGNPVVIEDVSPVEHALDIKTTANETVFARGKNLIPFDNKAYFNGRYVAGQTYEISGISFTVNDDGSVYAVGTATNAAIFYLYYTDTYAKGLHTVTLSGCPKGASNTTYFLRLKNASEASANYQDYGNGKTVENVNLTGSIISIVIMNGQTVDATFYPMLEFGNTASEFVSPAAAQSETADEYGMVYGIKAKEAVSVFTENNVDIEVVYNQKTSVAINEIHQEISDVIEKLGYRLINTVTFDEDGQFATFQTDVNGNNINNIGLNKAFVLFTGGFLNTSAKQSICLRCNGGSMYLLYKEFSVTAEKFYGFWAELEKVFSFSDRTVYKSLYPANMLTNFVADTELAQGLAGNNVALDSDLCVSRYDSFNNIQFGCHTGGNLIKAGSKVYLFGK